jgi:HEAT repeat protein
MRKFTIVLIAVAAATTPLMAARRITTSEAMYAFRFSDLNPTPPESWAPQDPADGLWRAGRDAINASEWQKAADNFRKLRTEKAYEASTYRGQAYYWEAYARAQMGGSSQLRQARSILQELKSEMPDIAKSIRDASSLLASVNSQLSTKFGDESSAAAVRESAKKTQSACPDGDDDDNPRVAALNALMQMDADAAMPILEKVLARRDECSEGMRAKAMWMIAQKHTPRSADLLLEAIKSDPSLEVRQQAVFWLSQMDSDKALVALEGILRSDKDAELQENALFALAQSKSPKASALLRDFAARPGVSSDARGAAIHWLGQSRDADSFAFLRDLFTKIDDDDSKEQIIFAISQQNNAQSAEWLMNIVMDEKQDVDMRKQALYWAGQSDTKGTTTGLSTQKLIGLYDRLTDTEMKEQLIFVYAQRKSSDFVDKLMDIAKTDKDPDLRKTAIYWLGQVGSKDPRVVKFLMDLING